MMKKNMATLTRIQENPKDKAAQNASIDASYSTIGLRDTAWKTAQTTGALSFMPYDEAKRYSNVYSSQADFLSQQDKILEDEAQFLGIIVKTNFGHKDATPEQASLVLERFGIWNAHLVYLDLMAQERHRPIRHFLRGKNRRILCISRWEVAAVSDAGQIVLGLAMGHGWGYRGKYRRFFSQALGVGLS
jgi:hypothetical protein